MSEEEVRSMVERLLQSVLQGRRKKRKAPPPRPGIIVDKPGPGNPHGIYVYESDKEGWRLIAVDGPAWSPRSNGPYLVYFDNTRCPACRLYDEYWFDFIRGRGRDVRLIIVLCAWFARECLSQAASATFKAYDIHASPTTIALCSRGGRTIWEKRYEGVLTLEELVAIHASLRERCRAE